MFTVRIFWAVVFPALMRIVDV